jgi:hypothetical protein
MKTIEVSDDVAKEIEGATNAEAGSILSRMAQEFVDVGCIGTPAGQRELVHTLTGKKLTIRADWSD